MKNIKTLKLNGKNRNKISHSGGAANEENLQTFAIIDEDEQMLTLSDVLLDDTTKVPRDKEMLLISLISQDQALFNPNDTNYRNFKLKDKKWLEIAERVGWSDLQCKLKWKAFRDQYCREIKKAKFQSNFKVKWKYFKHLEFLRPYALARQYRPRLPTIDINALIDSSSVEHNAPPIPDVNNDAQFSNIKIVNPINYVFHSDGSDNVVIESLTLRRTDDDKWTYITGSNNNKNIDNSTTVSPANNTKNVETNSTDTITILHQQEEKPLLLRTEENPQTTTDDYALYKALVDCIGDIEDHHDNVEQQKQNKQQPQHTQELNQEQPPQKFNLVPMTIESTLLNEANQDESKITDLAIAVTTENFFSMDKFSSTAEMLQQQLNNKQESQHINHNEEQQQLQQIKQEELILPNNDVPTTIESTEPKKPKIANSKAGVSIGSFFPNEPWSETDLLQQQTSDADEDEDDPIHTFLTIENYFEQRLIAFIHNEKLIYDTSNLHYRNTRLKHEVWEDIARKLNRTVKQCRSKWKALRDQFIREHKRLKDQENSILLPRWRHYDALMFLQNFIKTRSSDSDCHQNFPISPTAKKDDSEKIEVEEKEEERTDFDCPQIFPGQRDETDILVVEKEEEQSQDNVIENYSGNSSDEENVSFCVKVDEYEKMDIDKFMMDVNESEEDDAINDCIEQFSHNNSKSSQDDMTNILNNHNLNDININSNMATIILEPLSKSTILSQTFKSEETQLQIQNLTIRKLPQTEQNQIIDMPSLEINEITSNTTSRSKANNLQIHQNIVKAAANLSTCTKINSCNTYQSSLNERNGGIASAAAITDLEPRPAMPSEQVLNNNIVTTTETLTPQENNFNYTVLPNNIIATPTEDDEVGAFFKSVAMKVRNAKLSQVALTELEINILRLINNSLSN